MTSRESFGVGVRLFGVWRFCVAASYVSAFIDSKLYPATAAVQDGAAGQLIYATIELALAAFLLLWTRVVVAWSYGDPVATAGPDLVADDRRQAN